MNEIVEKRYNRPNDPKIMADLKKHLQSGSTIVIAGLKCGIARGTILAWWNQADKLLTKLQNGEVLSDSQMEKVDWYLQLCPEWAENIDMLWKKAIEPKADGKQSKVIVNALQWLHPFEFSEKYNGMTKDERDEHPGDQIPFVEKMALLGKFLADKELLIQIVNHDRTGNIRTIIGEVLDNPRLIESSQQGEKTMEATRILSKKQTA